MSRWKVWYVLEGKFNERMEARACALGDYSEECTWLELCVKLGRLH